MEVRLVDAKSKNKKKKKNCKRIRVTTTKALQRLFVYCRHVFKDPGTIPSPTHVHKICHFLDSMLPEDVGLSKDLQFFKPKSFVQGIPRVTYTTIYKCNNFSLCIFFLPKSAVIPMHNHPGMTVFSKLLLGTMHIKSYDWVHPVKLDDSIHPSQLRLARMKVNNVFTAPCNTSVLYPTTGGNIHAFTAITPCAVLDVLGPPYSKDDARDCSYYKDIPYTTSSKTMMSKEEVECYRWLEEIEMPKEPQMDVIEYLGPQVPSHRGVLHRILWKERTAA